MKKLTFLIYVFLFSTNSFSTEITILYTNNVDGYLKACNCPGNLFGGLIYFESVVNELRTNNKNTLFLDAGDLFPAKDIQPEAEYSIKFYNKIGIDALNIGDQEFWFGLDYLKSMQPLADFKFISANIFKNDSLLFQPYFVKNFDDVKVAVIGLINEDIFKNLREEKRIDCEIKATDDVLSNLIPEIKIKADIIILLSHSGLEKDKQIAEKFPEINLIIGAHSELLLKEPLIIGNTKIFQAGKYAHYLGVINFDYQPDQQVKLNHKIIKMEGIPITKSSLDLYDDYHEYSEEFLAEMYEQLKSSQKDYQAAPSVEVCAECHIEEYDHWWRTPHANAWRTIEKDTRTNDISCISCHTTLFNKEGGFVNLELTPNLKNVTCVSCHLDYEGHPEKKEEMKLVDEMVCIDCHDKPNSPQFDFEIYKKAVFHENRYYIIQSGDWLSKISGRYYQDVHEWDVIHQANRYDIENPNLIFPKEKIVVPTRPVEFENKNKQIRKPILD